MIPDRVLVVDDSFENRLVASGHLEAAGFAVALATDGTDALAQLEVSQPDLVLLDVLMPGLDGYETCRLIRANPATAELPVLFLTALGDRDTTEPAIAAGGDDILSKPFNRAELLLRVRALIRQRHAMTELHAMTERLAEQNVRLRRLEQQRRDVAALLAHDLKSPLTAVVTNAAALATDALTPAQRETVEDIRLGGVRACDMIRDLIDVSCAEDSALAPRLERFSLRDAVEEVVTVIRGLARSEGIALRTDVRVLELWADRGFVGRVVQNLVINAVQHAPRGTEVTLTATRDPHGVLVGVHDEGPGVPPGEVEHIFDKYMTGDASRSGRRGHGLGLVFCKLAVEAHGGRIWVENRPARGASFYLRLPQPSAATSEEPIERADVLIVDDDDNARKTIARALRNVCTVEVVSSGAEALARLRSGARYALVLCDVMMPTVTGFDVLDIVRREASDQAPRFVFVTGGARTIADELRLATCGVLILGKPFDRGQLLAVVSRYVSPHGVGTVEASSDVHLGP